MGVFLGEEGVTPLRRQDMAKRQRSPVPSTAQRRARCGNSGIARELNNLRRSSAHFGLRDMAKCQRSPACYAAPRRPMSLLME